MRDKNNILCHTLLMKTIHTVEKQIERVKNQLLKLGDMHPGSLSKQFNICGTPGCRCKDPVNPKKHGPYYQLSFVHQGKSSSRFIQPQDVPEIKRHVANYKKFKALVESWKTLAAELTKLKMDILKMNRAKKSNVEKISE